MAFPLFVASECNSRASCVENRFLRVSDKRALNWSLWVASHTHPGCDSSHSLRLIASGHPFHKWPRRTQCTRSANLYPEGKTVCFGTYAVPCSVTYSVNASLKSRHARLLRAILLLNSTFPLPPTVRFSVCDIRTCMSRSGPPYEAIRFFSCSSAHGWTSRRYPIRKSMTASSKASAPCSRIAAGSPRRLDTRSAT